MMAPRCAFRVRTARPGLCAGVVAGLLVFALGLAVPRAVVAHPGAVGVIDLHVDLSYRSLYKNAPFAEGSGEFRARDLLAGGLVGVLLPLFVPTDAQPAGRTVEEFERSYSWVFGQILRTEPYALPGCGTMRAGGARRAVETWLAFEGAGPLPVDELTIRRWMLRGVRVFGLVHSQHNSLATSSGQEHRREGLSERGRLFVERVFAAGGVVDVSHASDASTTDVLDLADKLGGVVVATHSNPRRLAPHPRNITDEHIRRVAQTGGVVGVNFHQTFLNPVTRTADVGDVARFMRYLASVGGDEVVAIGSDFEGGIRPAQGLSSALAYPALDRALAQLGVEESRIRRFFSGNARRVLCGAR